MLITPRKATLFVLIVLITVILIFRIKTTEEAGAAALEMTTVAEDEYVDSDDDDDEEPEYKEDQLWDKFDPNEVKPDKDVFFISSSGYCYGNGSLYSSIKL